MGLERLDSIWDGHERSAEEDYGTVYFRPAEDRMRVSGAAASRHFHLLPIDAKTGYEPGYI